jgi:hypothetical protein
MMVDPPAQISAHLFSEPRSNAGSGLHASEGTA